MSSKLRVGVIGMGRAGNKMHFTELKRFPEMYEIVAGCDWDAERRAAAAEAVPGIRLYEQVKDLKQELYTELGITEGILNGTATEQELLNYQQHTIKPFLEVICLEMTSSLSSD